MKRTKKQYESPHMEVFELKRQPRILAGSSGDGGTNPYEPQTPDTW